MRHEATTRRRAPTGWVSCGFPGGRRECLRLHGGRGYGHKYTDEEMAWLAECWVGKGALFMFNNLFMEEDALRFLQVLRRVEERS
ncbi:MAG: hypothetical protein HYU29_03320 [Chloroflexi bacterium]|nr:hypothetical protein [Chloroflexota bacterium]